MRKVWDWVVVGAGPHGCHLAAQLLESGVDRERLLLLDRHGEPLHLWNRRTARLGLDYLRSSGVHQIGVDPWSLHQFGAQHYGAPENWSARPYLRPRYSVFQEHCASILENYQLKQLFIQAEVEQIRSDGDTYEIVAGSKRWSAEKVVLALGGTPPAWPDWATQTEATHHLLDEDFPTKLASPLVVVGAGMTGVQFALSQADQAAVTVVTRSPLEIEEFDADPCWIGPKCLNQDFYRGDYQQRRNRIDEARRPGTVNRQVYDQFQKALGQGQLRLLESEVVGGSGRHLEFSDGSTLEFGSLVLATGFQPGLPGGPFTERLIRQLELPTTPCGFPVLTQDLEWRPGLFVTGGLAELELGPTSRNLAGARAAGKRIIAWMAANEGRRCQLQGQE